MASQTTLRKDHGYAWVVLLAAFLTNIINGGMLTCPSLLLVEWYAAFERSKSATAWTIAIQSGVRFTASVFTGSLINRFGCQKVLFTGSVLTACALVAFAFAPNLEVLYALNFIAGLGCSLMFTPPYVIIYDYFDKYKHLASGISLMGQSISTYVIVVLLRSSIDHYGWRGAMFILAGVMLNGCVMAMLMVPFNPAAERKQQKLADLFSISALKNITFVLFVISHTLFGTNIVMIYHLSTARAVTKGIPIIQASYLTSVIGICSTVSRLITSFVSNMSCTSNVGMFAVCVLLLAASLIFSCFQAETFVYAALCCCLSGLSVGACLTLAPPVIVGILGRENLAGGLGWTNTVLGFQSFITLPLAGFIYDITGDFNASFYTMGFVGLVGGLLALIVTFRHHTQKSSIETHMKEVPDTEIFKRTRTETVTQADEFGSQMHVRTESMTTS